MRLIALVGLLVTQVAAAAPATPPVATVWPHEVSSAYYKRYQPGAELDQLGIRE